MNEANFPAFPLDADNTKLIEDGYFYSGWGLTKREHYASQALQGLLVNCGRNGFSFDRVATEAVKQADALLNALEQ